MKHCETVQPEKNPKDRRSLAASPTPLIYIHVMQVRHHASQQEGTLRPSQRLVVVVVVVVVASGPKEERLQMVRPGLDQWHCAKPGAILDDFGFFQLNITRFRGCRVSVAGVVFPMCRIFSDLQWRVGAHGLQVEVSEVCHRGAVWICLDLSGWDVGDPWRSLKRSLKLVSLTMMIGFWVPWEICCFRGCFATLKRPNSQGSHHHPSH